MCGPWGGPWGPRSFGYPGLAFCGVPWGALGRSLGVLGVPWGPLGSSLGVPARLAAQGGRFVGSLGDPLECPSGSCGVPWGPLGWSLGAPLVWLHTVGVLWDPSGGPSKVLGGPGEFLGVPWGRPWGYPLVWLHRVRVSEGSLGSLGVPWGGPWGSPLVWLHRVQRFRALGQNYGRSGGGLRGPSGIPWSVLLGHAGFLGVPWGGPWGSPLVWLHTVGVLWPPGIVLELQPLVWLER